MKKTNHTRSESERKEKVTSVRLTENQHKRLQENANAAGMTVSNYMITTAVNGGSALTPKLLAQMQNVTNEACEAVSVYAPEKVKSIQKGMAKLWQELM